MTPKATPLPWAVDVIGETTLGRDVCRVVDADGQEVADAIYGDDAALICLAVNSHADLVAALEEVLAHTPEPSAGDAKAILQRARAALSKAKGEA